MFSSGTPLLAERRTRGGTVRRSQSRAGSIAGLAAGADAASASPSKSGLRTRTLPQRASSSRRQSLLPTGRAQSRAGSRLGSVALPDEDSADGEDAILLLEEDSEQPDNQGILLKSDTHSVSILGGVPRAHLPAEVLDVLANSDFYSDPHAATLDVDAGYACLVGRSKCYVWSIAHISSKDETPTPGLSPTCYVFPVPEAPGLSLSATTFSPVPFVAFVSMEQGRTVSSGGREPGFLLVTAWGRAVYWNSTSAALSGIDNHVDQDIGLAQGEVVRAMTALSPMRYVLATSGSRLFSVRIQTSFSTNAVLSIKPISKASGMFSRVGSLFGGTTLDPQGGIVALAASRSSAPKNQTSWAVYAATNHVIQEWKFVEDRPEFIGETDVYEALHDTLANVTGLQASGFTNLEVVDATISTLSSLTLLVAFTPRDSQQPSSARRKLSYAIAELQDGSITYMKALSYTHEADPRPLSSPKVHLASGEKLCFVTFPDVVIATFLDSALSFEESVALKDAAKDRILGTSVGSACSLTALAAHTGFLSLEIDIPHVRALALEAARIDPADLATRNLKNKLEQAVLFADSQQNPLTFDLTLTNDTGDLVSAAESVSHDILTSSPSYLPTILDLRAQIADRISRLHFLMKYLHDNSLMKRLSKTSKRHLAWDAEKLAGAMTLWATHSTGRLDHRDNVLQQAAENLQLLDDDAEDVVRNCLRSHTDRLQNLLAEYLPILQHQGVNTSLALNERMSILFQIDRDLSQVYKAVTRHRIEQGSLYGVPLGPDSQTCLSEPWSSRPKLLELLRLAFDVTDSLLIERSRVIGSSIDDDTNVEYGSGDRLRTGRAGASIEEERETQRLLKSYLVELADYTLAMHQERMSYLQSLGDEAQAVRELRDLLEVYVQLRPRVIDSMVRLHRANAAYDLAERYRDFRSLVVLCNDPSTGSTARVHHYIQKYKEDFAYALYDWYIESGRTHDLMTQDSMYGPMVSAYLKLRKLPGLAWMQDVTEGKVTDASKALLLQADQERKLSEQKFMLSVSKLARVAPCTRAEAERSEPVQQTLEAIDDRLDIVASHDRLMEVCKTVLDPRDLLKPVETQATVLMGRLCSRVTNAEVMKLGSYLFRRLLLGDALLPEDLVDLFSLKDNTSEDQTKDYAYALDLLGRDRQTPQTRRDIAAKSVWRRVYLADDFVDLRRLASKGNDEGLAEALRATALYTTVAASIQQESEGAALLRPFETLYQSTPEEDSSLMARFSTEVYHGEINMEAIASEYARESHLIRGMCEDKMVRLGEFFDEVQRLVKVDLEQAAATQGSILAEMDDSVMQ